MPMFVYIAYVLPIYAYDLPIYAYAAYLCLCLSILPMICLFMPIYAYAAYFLPMFYNNAYIILITLHYIL